MNCGKKLVFLSLSKLSQEHSGKLAIKILKISRRGLRSPDNAESDHFTWFSWRARQRNVPRILTHVHSHCSAHSILCLVILPLPSWFLSIDSLNIT